MITVGPCYSECLALGGVKNVVSSTFYVGAPSALRLTPTRGKLYVLAYILDIGGFSAAISCDASRTRALWQLDRG